MAGGPGRELAVLLAAAAEVEPALIWPTDIGRSSDLGRGFAWYLDSVFGRHQVTKSPRWPAALDLARLAALAVPTARTGNAV